MKCNYVIMNPPYARNLHLKFLEKAIEVSDNVISIQPVSWLEDIGPQLNEKSQYYKYENSISKHIYNLDKIEGKDATLDAIDEISLFSFSLIEGRIFFLIQFLL